MDRLETNALETNTELNLAREALRESDARYRALVEGVDVGIALIDADLNIVMVNDKQTKIVHQSASALVGKKCYCEFAGRDEVCLNCPGIQAMASGQPAEMYDSGRREAGERFAVHIKASPIFDEDGRATIFVEVIEDVTERMLAEEARQASDAKYSRLHETMRDAFVSVAMDGHIQECNGVYLEMLGYTLEEIHDRTYNDVTPGKWHAMEADIIATQVLVRGYSDIYEKEYRRKDGTVFPVELRAVLLKDDAGKPCGMWGIVRDITERKRAEEKLQTYAVRLQSANKVLEVSKEAAEAANRAKSEFLANMSHEIRTPMTAILGFGELLMTPGLPRREQREFLEGIGRNGKALLELINAILDLSRIEADRLPLEKTDCLLRPLLNDVLSAVKVEADKKGLRLHVDCPFPLPEQIHTDPARLRQILVNLVGNAVKFTTRGEVRLDVGIAQGHEAGQMRFAISDTGIGIPVDKIGQLFQPFTQVDGSASRRYGGTGLGLAISKRLARALGGDVEVVSELGKGSTFTLTVDVGLQECAPVRHDPTLTAADDTTLPDEPKSSMHGRVLLAEDAPDIQRIVRLLLHKLNVDVAVAGNGQLACDMAEKSIADGKPYDLIFMDIQMPQMNGYDATRWLRRSGWRGPIVALTAHAMVGDRAKCLAAGCDEYMAKPVLTGQLQEVLARFLTPTALAPPPSFDREEAADLDLSSDAPAETDGNRQPSLIAAY